MYERFDNYSSNKPFLRKTVGWSLVAVGFIALIAPIVPGAPIVFIGLELLGLRIILMDKVKGVFSKREESQVEGMTALKGSQEAS